MLVEKVLDVDLRTKPAEIITRRCVDERVGRQVAGRAVDLGLDRTDIADATADKGIAEFIARINTRRALRQEGDGLADQRWTIVLPNRRVEDGKPRVDLPPLRALAHGLSFEPAVADLVDWRIAIDPIDRKSTRLNTSYK